MCEYLDYEVKKLKRSRIMNVELGNMKPGQWRDLTQAEMAEINQAVQGSSKTAVDTAQPKNKLAKTQDTNEVQTSTKAATPKKYQYTPKTQDNEQKNRPTTKSKPNERNKLSIKK
jgi:23S rRNA pseudouridine2604 synthase